MQNHSYGKQTQTKSSRRETEGSKRWNQSTSCAGWRHYIARTCRGTEGCNRRRSPFCVDWPVSEQAWLHVQKKSLVATERLRARVKKRRHNWFRHHVPAMQAHPDRLVFIDETSVKTNLTRQYGRSLCGSRLEMNAPFGAWGTQTFIAGLTQDNLIAPWIISGAMDGQAFEAYVRNVLAPELQPGTVVILTTLLPITITQQPQPCGTSAAGSFTCPRTRLTSTQLRWPSQNARLTSEGL